MPLKLGIPQPGRLELVRFRYALVFCFKWKGAMASQKGPLNTDEELRSAVIYLKINPGALLIVASRK